MTRQFPASPEDPHPGIVSPRRNPLPHLVRTEFAPSGRTSCSRPETQGDQLRFKPPWGGPRRCRNGVRIRLPGDAPVFEPLRRETWPVLVVVASAGSAQGGPSQALAQWAWPAICWAPDAAAEIRSPLLVAGRVCSAVERGCSLRRPLHPSKSAPFLPVSQFRVFPNTHNKPTTEQNCDHRNHVAISSRVSRLPLQPRTVDPVTAHQSHNKWKPSS